MLYVLLLFGVAELFVLVFGPSYAALWYPEIDTRPYRIRFIISTILVFGLLFGLHKINNMTYEESLKNGEWTLQVLPVENSPIIGEKRKIYLIYDTNEIYWFYYQSKEGKFEIGKVIANETKKYEGDYAPHIVRYKKYTRSKLNPILRKILLFTDEEDDPSEYTYEIYVPKDTFVNITNIDFNKCIRVQTIYSY